jgi:hypothetical protein
VQRVLANGVRWAASDVARQTFTADYHRPGWYEQ